MGEPLLWLDDKLQNIKQAPTDPDSTILFFSQDE